MARVRLVFCVFLLLLFFFFSSRRRHTRLQGDWSSDVCSSDLRGLRVQLYLSLARKPLWPQRQLRSANVACDSGADKEVAGGQSTWRTYGHVLGNRLSFA